MLSVGIGGTGIAGGGLLNRVIAAIRRNNGVLYWPADNQLGDGNPNLLSAPEDFSAAAWTKTTSGTALAPVVTANAATAPDGTTTAELVVLDRGAGNTSSDISWLSQAHTLTVGATYTLSMWVKAASAGEVGKTLALRDGANANTVFTLTAEWTRIVSAPFVALSATSNGLYNRGTFTTGNSVSVHLWGAKLESGSTATTYTSQAVLASRGAFTDSTGLSPVTVVGDVLGLIGDRTQPTIARRNLLTWSEDFTQWTKNNAGSTGLTSNAGAAPNGAMTADLLYPTGSLNTLGVYRTSTLTVGVPYTFSVLVKPSGKSWVFVGSDANISKGSFFNVTTGALGATAAGHTHTITADSNGYYRCFVTFTPSVATNYPFVGVVDADNSMVGTASGLNGLLLGGAQLETGSTATAYQRIDAGQGEWLSGNYAANTAAWQATTASKPLIVRVPKRVGGELVTNGTFDTNVSGWTPVLGGTITHSSGSAIVGSSAGSDRTVEQIITTKVGSVYQISVNVSAISAGAQTIAAGTASGSGNLYAVPSTALGQRSATFTATTTTTYIGWFCGDANRTATIDNISVREVLEFSNAMSFDGSNDFLQTGLTTGNEGWVCAGVRTTSDATQAIVWGGANSSTEAGAMLRLAFAGAGLDPGLQVLVCNGTTREFDSLLNVPRNTAAVVDGGWSASTLTHAVNGTELSKAKTVNSTAAIPVRVGQTDVGNPFVGTMTATVYCAKLPSAADRALIRRWIGSLQGQTL